MGHSLSEFGGGHNPIEIAQAAKPIIVGHKVQNFLETYDLLTAHDACVQVQSIPHLAKKIMELMQQPKAAQMIAKNSYQLYQQHYQRSQKFLIDFTHRICHGRA